jgi:hypothetical protein
MRAAKETMVRDDLLESMRDLPYTTAEALAFGRRNDVRENPSLTR